MTAFAIREASVADARAIAEVLVEGWRWAYEGLVPEDTLTSLDVDAREQQWHEALAADRGRATRLVATDGEGRVIGFVAGGSALEDEDLPAPPADAGQVYAIYLRDGVQGTGVGRALLAAACERLRADGFPGAFLWVLEANDRARRFYEVAGWELDGSRGVHAFVGGDRPIVRYAVEF